MQQNTKLVCPNSYKLVKDNKHKTKPYLDWDRGRPGVVEKAWKRDTWEGWGWWWWSDVEVARLGFEEELKLLLLERENESQFWWEVDEEEGDKEES